MSWYVAYEVDQATHYQITQCVTHVRKPVYVVDRWMAQLGQNLYKVA